MADNVRMNDKAPRSKPRRSRPANRRRKNKRRPRSNALPFALGALTGSAICAAAVITIASILPFKRQDTNHVEMTHTEAEGQPATPQTSEHISIQPPEQSSERTSEQTTKQTLEPATKQPPVPHPSAASPVAFPLAGDGARLSLVLDDAGGDVAALRHCLALPFPITVAVMPGLEYSRQCADETREAGDEVLLHQPMQALDLSIKPGARAITPEMKGDEAAHMVADNMASLGTVAGVNNHEGSLITENAEVMAGVLRAARDGGAYYLDSRTTSGTRVGDASAITGVPYYERDVFLDNSHDKQAIIEQIRRALEIANRDGAAIMIGHVRGDDALVATLKDIAPQLQALGYIFCTVSNSGALRGQ